MTQPGILFDENLPPRLALQMRRHAPAIPVRSVGDSNAPPFGTLARNSTLVGGAEFLASDE